MLRQKIFVSGTIIAALILLGFALQQRSEKQKTEAALISAKHGQKTLEAQVSKLQKQLAVSDQKVAALVAETKVFKTTGTRRGSGTEVPIKITHAYVESRYKRAQELAKSGDPAEALSEFLWCYDEGMPPIAGYGGVRYSYLLSQIAKLGEKYPPALAALRERRDNNEKDLAAGSADFDVIQGFRSINTALKENRSLLHYYDRLPADTEGKQTMGLLVYDELAETRRYNEAAQIKSYQDMLHWFEEVAEMPKAKNGKTIETDKKYATNIGAGYVEVLAGAGKLADARDLAEVIRAYNNSPEAAALLEKKAARAGQPNLFAPMSAPETVPTAASDNAR